MDIATHKLELINKIIQLDDISVFLKITNILNEYSSKNDKAHEKHIPIDLLFKLIKQSEHDYLEGKITKNEDFEIETLSW